MFTPKQAADELARSLRSDGVRAYRDMIADAEDLVRDWRSRPGPWIETARETPADRGIDGNVLAWHAIEGCHYTVPARTVSDYQSEHPLWMEIPEGGIPEPRPEPTREQLERDRIVSLIEVLENEIKHTSHADGLGMGDQKSEALCREIVEKIREIEAEPRTKPRPDSISDALVDEEESES